MARVPAQLADAALRFSDNTAGNLLLQEIGGPTALTAFAASLGATSTRLDRIEPELNEATPGDERDTSTPDDIAQLYGSLLLDRGAGALTSARLGDWMLRNTTSGKRIRAGLDGDHELADKTGAGSYGVVNDAGSCGGPARNPDTRDHDAHGLPGGGRGQRGRRRDHPSRRGLVSAGRWVLGSLVTILAVGTLGAVLVLGAVALHLDTWADRSANQPAARPSPTGSPSPTGACPATDDDTPGGCLPYDPDALMRSNDAYRQRSATRRTRLSRRARSRRSRRRWLRSPGRVRRSARRTSWTP
ncbi:serine hydrolase [Oerskovia sp. M15]